MRTNLSSAMILIGGLIALASGCAKTKPPAPASANLKGRALLSQIAAGTTNLEAVLGSAYQSEKQLFVGDACVKGTVPVATGTATAGFTFQESMSESQLSSELGFAIGGHARSGVVEYSASANFLTNSVSNSLSVSAAWESSYLFPVDKLTAPTLTDTGLAVRGNDEHWAETCGDEYVAEAVRGAKLFFSIRVDFTTQAEKEAFQAKFSVSGPLAGVDGSLNQASASFSRHTKVTVSAYQVGGDVSKVTGIFDQSAAGQDGFMQCELGSFEKCAQVINAALKYATDVNSGFPSQLAPGVLPGAAVLDYRTVRYSALGIYPQNYPGLTDAIRLARQKVSDAFEQNYHWDVSAQRLLRQRNLGSRRLAIQAETDKVEANLNVLLGISKVCYETPTKCWDTEQAQMKLADIDEEVFAPISFLKLCQSADAPDSAPETAQTLQRIRAQIVAAPDATCDALAAKVLEVRQLNLSGASAASDVLDLRFLSPLVNLERLSIARARLTDVSPLGDLVNLKSLDLQGNRLKELDPLSDMVDLAYLNLDRNLIQNVAPIAGLPRIQFLLMAGNLITDLSALKFFPQIVSVDLKSNPLVPKDLEDFRARMPVGTTVSF